MVLRQDVYELNNRYFAGRAFRVFAANSILASLGVTVGTTVDAVIIGNALGQTGLAALNVAIPIYMLYNLISFAIGIGGATLVSVAAGEEKPAEAQKQFSLSLFWGVFLGLLITLAGVFFSDSAVSLLGGGAMSREYIMPILYTAPLFIVAPILNLMLRSDADPALSTLGIAASVVVNLVLDIVFVYLMDWGMRGAAAAMIAGQLSALAVYLLHFSKKDITLRLKVRLNELKGLLRLWRGGISTASSYAYMCVYILVFNNLLARAAGDAGIAVFSVLFNVSLFAYAVFDGISLALPTLIGTFKGEKDTAGISLTMKNALLTSAAAGTLVAVLILLFPEGLMSLFGIKQAPGALTLRYYAPSALFACINSLFAAYFQAVGRSGLSACITLMRGFLFILIIGPFLIASDWVRGLGAVFTAAEVLCFIIWLIAAYIIKRKNGFKTLLLFEHINVSPEDVYEATISKSLDELPVIVQSIEDFCERHGISSQKAYCINLTVEELAANIIQFGFTDRRAHYISIKLTHYRGETSVRLRDDATGYNPFEKGEGNDGLDFLGVEMIRKIAKSFYYRRSLIFNNLLIIL